MAVVRRPPSLALLMAACFRTAAELASWIARTAAPRAWNDGRWNPW